MFRRQSLDKLSSPDRLDQLLRVVRPQAWVVLVCMGLGMTWAVWWGFRGQIPVTVEGMAILVRPEMVVPIEATVDGRVVAVRHGQGDVVDPPSPDPAAPAPRSPFAANGSKDPAERARAAEEQVILEGARAIAELVDAPDPESPDWVLFELSDPVVESDLRKERAHLRAVVERNVELFASEQVHREGKTTMLKEQIDKIDKRIDEFEKLLVTVTDIEGVLESKREDLEQFQPDEMAADRRKRLEELEGTDRDLITEEDEFRIMNQILQLEIDSQMFDLRQLDISRTKSSLNDWMGSLTMRRGELDQQLDQLLLDWIETSYQRAAELGDIRRRIRWLLEQRALGHVTLPAQSCEECVAHGQDGVPARMISITTVRNEMVRTGDVLGRAQFLDPHVAMSAIVFVPVERGKKIDPDTLTEVRVSPTSVERERHGSLEGHVRDVPSEHPVTVDMAAHILGDRELAEKLLGDGIYLLVEVELHRVCTSSNCPPDARTCELAAMTESEDAGTGAAICSCNAFADPTHQARLRWTGDPPDRDPTVGTTCSARITLEKVRPIDLLFEFFAED